MDYTSWSQVVPGFAYKIIKTIKTIKNSKWRPISLNENFFKYFLARSLSGDNLNVVRIGTL